MYVTPSSEISSEGSCLRSSEIDSMHTLHRAIHDGVIPVDLATRDDSLADRRASCNFFMGWSAEHLQRAYEEIRAEGGEPQSDDMLRVAPTKIKGVNLRDTFEFR